MQVTFIKEIELNDHDGVDLCFGKVEVGGSQVQGQPKLQRKTLSGRK